MVFCLFVLYFCIKIADMKVEHITFGGSTSVRDTKDIYPETREFFKPLQSGNVTHKIDNTPFTCKITVDKGIAIFDLLVKDSILCTNICCFAKEDKEAALLYAKDITSKIDKKLLLTNPKEDCFIVTVVINPLVALFDLATAGEIELYIYDAIYEGLQKRSSSDSRTISSVHNAPAGIYSFEVGKPFPWKKYVGRGDITVAVFNTASFDVVVSLVNPSPEEIKLFRQGDLKTGLFNYKNVPFLYFDFCEYSVDVSLNINKLTDAEIDDWLNAEANAIDLYLIDGQTGILYAKRMIGINFMEDIRDILEAQTQQTKEETEELITEAINKYTTEQMQKQAMKSMLFRR